MKRTVISRRYFGVVFIVLAMALAPMALWADTIPFNLDVWISDYKPAATPPPPWVTATFEDTGSGEVTLTLTGANLTDNTPDPDEHVGFFYFNVDPSYGGSLSFSAGPYTTDVGNDTFTLGNYSNPRTFDVRIYFTGDALGKGDTIPIVITGASLNASIFNVPDPVGLFAAAWIEDITVTYPGEVNPDGSPKIETGHAGGIGTAAAIPEPATLLLLGSGLVGLAGFARRKFRK